MPRIDHSITVGTSQALGACNYCGHPGHIVIEFTMAPGFGCRACQTCAVDVADLLERFAARARDFSNHTDGEHNHGDDQG